MRVAVASSVTLHVALITVTAIALPRSAYTPVELPPVLPVEFLAIAEETNIAPAVVEEAEAPEPEIAPEPQVAAELSKPPPPKPQPEPEPVVEPEPEQVAPEPEPAPPPVEEMAELKPIEPEPEPEPEAPSVEDIAEVMPAAKPEIEPASTVEDAPEDNFFTQTAALIDKAPRKEKARQFHQRQEPQPDETPERAPNEAAGLQTGLTVSEMDAIRAQMKRCWRPPTGAPNAGELVVVLRVRFQPDGYVMGKPKVLDPTADNTDSYLRAAADRAVAAVLQCQPFSLPVERYRSWATSEISFDPRFLLGR